MGASLMGSMRCAGAALSGISLWPLRRARIRGLERPPRGSAGDLAQSITDLTPRIRSASSWSPPSGWCLPRYWMEMSADRRENGAKNLAVTR